MSVFQTINLPADAVKVRWQEPYITQGLNQKALSSQPRGVVAGFVVVPNFGYVVDVQLDPALGLSIANVLETTGGKYSVTVLQTNPIQIDLTAQAGSTVFIVVDAQYAVGSTSASQIKVVDAVELGTNPDLVVLAKVAVPASPPVVVANINTGYATLAGDSIPAFARPQFNLVFNPSFEADLVGGSLMSWNAVGILAVCSQDFARTGTKSAKLTAIGVPSNFVGPWIAITPGLTYRVGAWFRTDGGGLAGTGLQLRVQFADENFSALGVTNIEDPVTGVVSAFAARQSRWTAPANAAFAQVVVQADNTTTGIAYVDDVEFSSSVVDALARSNVFGGPGVVADNFHSHTAAGQFYSGGPSWADGTTNPSNTIEGQLDKIVTDLAGVGGAAKLGFTPSSPVDLTAVRIDTALNELDDKKAGIGIANTFTRSNTFNNSLTVNQPALVAFGNGTGEGIRATGGGSGAVGVYGFGTVGFAGVRGDGNGLATGGYFVGGTAGAAPFGGPGVIALGVGQKEGIYAEGGGGGGAGVFGRGGASGIGVIGEGVGAASVGVRGTGAGTGAGVQGIAGGTAGAAGVFGQGSGANTTGVSGTGGGNGAGGSFVGGGGGGPGVTAIGAGGNTVAFQIGSISNIIAFNSAKTNLLWLTPFRFVKSASTLDYALPTSSFPRMFRTSNANVKAWCAFHLPVGAVITAAWLNVYHDPTTPAATTINVSLRKRDVAFQSDPLSTPNDSLNTSPLAVTTVGGSSNTVALTLTGIAFDRTQNNEATEFMVELDWAAGGDFGSSEHFVSGMVIQYQYTRVTR